MRVWFLGFYSYSVPSPCSVPGSSHILVRVLLYVWLRVWLHILILSSRGLNLFLFRSYSSRVLVLF